MPILGITASSILKSTTSYDSIASANGTGSSGTITFSSIPATYASLQLRGVAKWNTNFDVLQLRFNGDSAANYASHHLMGDSSSAIATGLASQSRIRLSADGYSFENTGYVPLIIDIHDYASTTKTKTVRIFLGSDQNTSPRRVLLASGLWNNTAAITTVALSTQSASNFSTETLISLYGIKGA
jgi:hypothetical protein